MNESERILTLQGKQLKRKSIKLEARTSEPVMVMADSYMINTVLRNLISNSVKFTGENGTIQIRTQKTDKMPEITVEDTGIGMSDEEIGNLFQLDMSVSRKGPAGF